MDSQAAYVSWPIALRSCRDRGKNTKEIPSPGILPLPPWPGDDKTVSRFRDLGSLAPNVDAEGAGKTGRNSRPGPVSSALGNAELGGTDEDQQDAAEDQTPATAMLLLLGTAPLPPGTRRLFRV